MARRRHALIGLWLAAGLVLAAPGFADEPPKPGETPHTPEPAATPSPQPLEKPAEPPVPEVKNLEPIPKETAVSILGKKVRGLDGTEMGRVVDLLLDREGRPHAVIVDFGGFLGVGSRKIAIDWRLLRFDWGNQDMPLALGLSKAEVQAAPEYKDTAQPPQMVGPPPGDADATR